ncbi:hypothetical protein [Thiocapsa roseopersicina]|uniref:hypothetical protein n=1 Tax=Thiocapsa roseopersicina TaxID=1058 RepID=UPI001113D051|nr:hypothetical protein [Thiocapsa roseopersicina]
MAKWPGWWPAETLKKAASPHASDPVAGSVADLVAGLPSKIAAAWVAALIQEPMVFLDSESMPVVSK